MRDDGMNLHASNIFTPELGQSSGGDSIMVSMQDTRATEPVIRALKEILIRHAGDAEFRIRLVRDDVGRVLGVPYPIKVTADLYGELKSLLGSSCLV